MEIPKKFELGGIEWHVQTLLPPDNNMASCNQEIGVIHVKKQPNRSTMEQAFVHELVHAILYGIGKNTHDEEYVDAFAHLLYQYMKKYHK